MNTSKEYYCNNCGKYGHLFKKCRDAITSLGVIAVKIDMGSHESLTSEVAYERMKKRERKQGTM